MLVAGTVRNPFDWLVSQYLRFLPVRAGDQSGVVKTAAGYIQGDPRMKGAPEEFEAWLVNRYRRPPPRPAGPDPAEAVAQARRLAGGRGRGDALRAAPGDLRRAGRRVGIAEHLEIPVVNQTVSREGRDFREWYTPAAARSPRRRSPAT